MAINPTSPITGTAQTGLTSPTYTVVTDVPPSLFSEQVAVTALGGTQSSVTTHSVNSPFTLTAFRPSSFRAAPRFNPVSGAPVAEPGNNVWKILTRKGVAINPGYPLSYVATAETKISLPAGCETSDSQNVRAMMSAHIGYLSQQSAGIGDALVTGLM